MLDNRDIAIFEATPMVCVPRYSVLDAFNTGGYRYLAAADGLYLQATSTLFDICVKLSDVTLPYGHVKPYLNCLFGLPDRSLWDELVKCSQEYSPNEIAAQMYWCFTEKRFKIHYPKTLHCDTSTVTYYANDISEHALFCDVHSHGNGKAYFSATDDDSDVDGVHFSVVIGCCDTATPTFASRLCVFGNFIPLPWNPLAYAL